MTIAKRMLDVVVAAIALALLSPLLVIASVGIKATSRGPVFHRARRAGKDGRPFELLKFRSMRADAATTGPGITRSADDRVTAIGRVLRRLKIDELPQLINVLRGDMSLVGPRPENPQFVELYTPEQRRILTVKPGLTSAASIVYRNEEDLLVGEDWASKYVHVIMPDKLKIDLEYLRRASFVEDLKILGRTVLVLFR